MKIQGLAVIAIIIILPMTIILASYSQTQIKTLQLQVQYDSKLKNATYDAIKAFQLNMSNSDTSDLANSKLRDINASISTFYNSLSSHFSMSGYGKSVLQNYVPAVVYGLYDGYYIYSAYNNTLDDTDTFVADATYKDGELMYGLKPYVYYSCRYKVGATSDFVITYSLDSYITIQGIVNGTEMNESGYLLTGVEKAGDTYKYRGIEISAENNKEGLKQKTYVAGDTSATGENRITISGHDAGSVVEFHCKKINGVKYYQDSAGKVFTSINGKKYLQNSVAGITENKSAIQFYKDAYDFREKVINTHSDLKNLRISNAVDTAGTPFTDTSKYPNQDVDNPFSGNDYIFKELDNLNTSNTYIEEENSNFNAHKLQVIKNSVETNLMSAIANYNSISTSSVNFQMPRLNDEEWEQISQNVSMITFLQGLNIGGRIYNGHAIVANNTNEDFVSENSIYILNNGEYHSVTDPDIVINSNTIGILSTDFARRSADAKVEYEVPDGLGGTTLKSESKTIYYYPREDSACYNSIINPNANTNTTSISEYLLGGNKKIDTTNPKYELAKLYYTALGRERYGMYRVQNKFENVQEELNKNEIKDKY